MKPEIKERISQIQNGIVPEGYKKTDAGIIPIDWRVEPIGNLCSGKGKYGLNAPACEYKDGLPIYLRITDIDENGKFIRDNKVCVNNKDSAEYYLQKNDILFARTGGTVGKSYLYDLNDGKLVYAGFLIKFSIDDKKIKPLVFKNQLNTNRYWKWVEIISTRSGQPGINAEEYAKYNLIVPSIKEQERIANILEKWDKAIELQEQLIEKLEIQRYGALQKIVSNNQWNKQNVGEFAKECKTRNKNGKCKNVKSVSNKHGFISQNEQFSKTVASSDVSNYKIVKYKNIAYNPSRINVGSIAVYEESDEAIVSPMYVVFECCDIEPKLLCLLLSTDKSKYNIVAYCTGSVRNSLSFIDLCKIKIDVPDKKTQKSILDCFDHIDENIRIQNEKLELLKQQQKSMQQLLLTGIVRV